MSKEDYELSQAKANKVLQSDGSIVERTISIKKNVLPASEKRKQEYELRQPDANKVLQSDGSIVEVDLNGGTGGGGFKIYNTTSELLAVTGSEVGELAGNLETGTYWKWNGTSWVDTTTPLNETSASEVSYDDTLSGSGATNVQEAVDGIYDSLKDLNVIEQWSLKDLNLTLPNAGDYNFKVKDVVVSRNAQDNLFLTTEGTEYSIMNVIPDVYSHAHFRINVTGGSLNTELLVDSYVSEDNVNWELWDIRSFTTQTGANVHEGSFSLPTKFVVPYKYFRFMIYKTGLNAETPITINDVFFEFTKIEETYDNEIIIENKDDYLNTFIGNKIKQSEFNEDSFSKTQNALYFSNERSYIQIPIQTPKTKEELLELFGIKTKASFIDVLGTVDWGVAGVYDLTYVFYIQAYNFENPSLGLQEIEVTRLDVKVEVVPTFNFTNLTQRYSTKVNDIEGVFNTVDLPLDLTSYILNLNGASAPTIVGDRHEWNGKSPEDLSKINIEFTNCATLNDGRIVKTIMQGIDGKIYSSSPTNNAFGFDIQSGKFVMIQKQYNAITFKLEFYDQATNKPLILKDIIALFKNIQASKIVGTDHQEARMFLDDSSVLQVDEKTYPNTSISAIVYSYEPYDPLIENDPKVMLGLQSTNTNELVVIFGKNYTGNRDTSYTTLSWEEIIFDGRISNSLDLGIDSFTQIKSTTKADLELKPATPTINQALIVFEKETLDGEHDYEVIINIKANTPPTQSGGLYGEMRIGGVLYESGTFTYQSNEDEYLLSLTLADLYKMSPIGSIETDDLAFYLFKTETTQTVELVNMTIRIQ